MSISQSQDLPSVSGEPFDTNWASILNRLQFAVRCSFPLGTPEPTSVSLHSSPRKSATFQGFDAILDPIWLDDAKSIVLFRGGKAGDYTLRVATLFVESWAYEDALDAIAHDVEPDVDDLLDRILLQVEDDYLPFIGERLSASDMRSAIERGFSQAEEDDRELAGFGAHCRGIAAELRRSKL